MPDVGKVTLWLVAKAQRFKAAIAQASKDTKKLEADLNSLATRSTIAFAAMGMGMRKVVGTYTAFQDSVTRAAAIGIKKNESLAGNIDTLSAKSIELAKTTVFSATEAADALQILAMSGQDAATASASLGPVLQLAAAGAVSLEDSARITTSVMAGFGKSTAELSEVNDILASAITGSKLSIGTLGEAFKMVGPIAKASGVSLKSTTAALAILGNAGVDASLAGTALRRMLINLQAPTSGVTKALTEMGANFRNADGSLKDFVGIVQELERVGATTEDMFKLFGVRGLTAAEILKGAGSKALKVFEKRLDGAKGKAKALADTAMKTLGGRINSMKASIEGATIAIGKGMEPILRKLANTAGWVADVVAKIPKPLMTFIGTAAVVATGLTGLTAATLVYRAAKIKLLAAIPKLIAGLKVYAAAQWAAMKPLIPMALAGAAALVGLVGIIGAGVQIWNAYKREIIDAWDTSTDFVKNSVKWFSKLAIEIAQSMMGSFKAIGAAVATLFKKIKAGKFGTAFGDAGKAFNAELKKSDKLIADMKKEVDKTDWGLWEGGAEALKGAALTAGDSLKDAISKGWEDSKKWGADFKRVVIDPLSKSLGMGADAIAAAFGLGPEELKRADEEARRMAGKDVVPPPSERRKKDRVLGDRPGLDDPALHQYQQRMEYISGAMTGLMSSTLSAAGSVGSIVKGFAAGGPMGGLLAVIQGFIDNSEPLQKALGFLDQVFKYIVNAFDPLFEALGPLLNAILAVVRNAIEPLRPVIKLLGDVLRPLLAILTPLVTIIQQLNPAFLSMRLALAVLEPALAMVADVAEMLAQTMWFLFSKVADIWNSLMDSISGLLKSIGDMLEDVPFIGKDMQAAFHRMANGLRDAARIQVQPYRAMARTVSEMNDHIVALNTPIEELSETAEKATESLTNVPQVLKLSALRYAAIDAGQQGILSDTSGLTETTANDITVNVSEAADVDGIAGIMHRIKRDAANETGAQSPANAPATP